MLTVDDGNRLSVGAQSAIAGRERQPFYSGSCDKCAVERIRVMLRQTRSPHRVFGLERQHLEPSGSRTGK